MSDLVAVAVIVDSSINLAANWNAVLAQYLTPLFTRLMENRATNQFFLGLVAYATADYRPGPILAKRYFNAPQLVHKELKEEATKLGIGRTGAGGKMGMAALEGYAAAIELFDLFHRNVSINNAGADNLPEGKTPIYHIIHISAAEPDGAIHPMFNQTSDLDSLSWKVMPDELRKRNINLNLVLLRKSQTLVDLHKSMGLESLQPWFPVRQGHSILLSAQSGWSSAKRAVETQPSENAAEVNRPRVASPKPILSSPSVPTAKPAAPQTTVVPPTGTEPTANRPPQPAQFTPEQMAKLPPQIQQLVRKVIEMEKQMKVQWEKVALATKEGRKDEAEILQKDLQQKMPMFATFRNKVIQQYRLLTAPGANPNAANPAANANSSTDAKKLSEAREQPAAPKQPANSMQNQPATIAPSASGTSQPTSQLSSTPSDSQSLAQFVKDRKQAQQPHPETRASVTPAQSQPATVNNGLRFPHPGMPAHIPPNLLTQMQKMVGKEGIQGHGVLATPTMIQAQVSQSGQPGPSNAPGPPPQVRPPVQIRPSWKGTIRWTGRTQEGLPNVQMEAQVIASASSDHKMREDLWPSVLELIPSSEPAVPTPDLRDWINHHKPVICSIVAAHTNSDNLRHFNSFIQLLFERNLYAVGRWAIPHTGEVRQTILIFPTGKDDSVAAAVFPETGIPEFPKSTHTTGNALPQMGMAPQPGMHNPMNMTGQLRGLPFNVAQLQNMTPQQRQLLAARVQAVRARQQQDMMQKQAASQPVGPPGSGVNLSGNFAGASGWGANVGGMPGTNIPGPSSNVGQTFNLNLNPGMQAQPGGTNFGPPPTGMNMGQSMQGFGGIPMGLGNFANLNPNQQALMAAMAANMGGQGNMQQQRLPNSGMHGQLGAGLQPGMQIDPNLLRAFMQQRGDFGGANMK